MTKKKLILFIIAILALVISGNFIWRSYNVQNMKNEIRKEVLNSLEENLRFCQILRDDINLSSQQGKFWLMCDKRPFYAEYEKGEIKTELNGWSFLKKEQELWDCDFYDSRDSELIFYCPYNFSSQPLAKYYKFDPSSLEIIKIKEENFQNLISTDIKKNYPFLNDCITPPTFTGGGGRGYSPFADITFICKDYTYVVKTNLGFLIPPILIDSKVEDKERAKLAFEKSFNITPTLNGPTTASYQFDTCKLSITYPPLTNLDEMWVAIQPTGSDNESIKDALIEVGKYFIFPPLEIKNVEFISGQTDKLYYKVDGVMIEIVRFEGNNIIMQRVEQRYYENI